MKHRQGTSLIAIAAVSFIIISSLLCGCADLDGICEPTEPLPVQTPLPSPPQTALGSKTVVIDAGHGGQDGGAVGRITGVKEDGINLSVALLLKDKLEQLGYTVIMTRTSDSALADAKNTQLIGENAMSTLPKDWDDVVDDVIANYNRVIKEYSQSSMSTRLQNTY